jgi:hypothetical protein
MRYSKGICWIGDCRIPFVDDTDFDTSIGGMGSIWGNKEIGEGKKIIPNQQGRFTPNLLVCDDMLNDGSVTNSSGHIRNNTKTQTIYGGGKGFPPIKVDTAPNDKGSNSRYYDLDKWFDKVIDSL